MTPPNEYLPADIIRKRWSPRAFADRPVERPKLVSLFEAARWAPSSGNEQPWSFFVATKEEPSDFELMASCLVEGNSWAKEAPVLALSVARTYMERHGRDNRHGVHDTGIALENLLLQAFEVGLVAHPMAGFDGDKARQLFHIPDRHEPMAMIAIGYYGNPELLPEKLRLRETAPRVRKPLENFVFTGDWGKMARLL